MKVPSVVVLLVVLGTASAQIEQAITIDTFNVCAAKTGAMENYDDIIIRKIMPETPEGMCLVQCLLKKIGMLNPEGQYDREGTKTLFFVMFGVEEIEKHQVAFARIIAEADECGSLVAANPNRCEGAAEMYVCGLLTMQKHKYYWGHH